MLSLLLVVVVEVVVVGGERLYKNHRASILIVSCDFHPY